MGSHLGEDFDSWSADEKRMDIGQHVLFVLGEGVS